MKSMIELLASKKMEKPCKFQWKDLPHSEIEEKFKQLANVCE